MLFLDESGCERTGPYSAKEYIRATTAGTASFSREQPRLFLVGPNHRVLAKFLLRRGLTKLGRYAIRCGCTGCRVGCSVTEGDLMAQESGKALFVKPFVEKLEGEPVDAR
jgi:hypothetical protein